MIDNIDRLLTQLANHDNAIDTICDDLANGTVRRTRISDDELHHGHAGEPDLFRQGCLCAPRIVASLGHVSFDHVAEECDVDSLGFACLLPVRRSRTLRQRSHHLRRQLRRGLLPRHRRSLPAQQQLPQPTLPYCCSRCGCLVRVLVAASRLVYQRVRLQGRGLLRVGGR